MFVENNFRPQEDSGSSYWRNASLEDDLLRATADTDKVDRVKRIWYLSPMQAAKVQAQSRQNLRCSLI